MPSNSLAILFLFSTGSRHPAALPTHPPTPPQPTPPPATLSPVPDDSISIDLTPYVVAYTLGDNTMPQRQQYDELTELTDSYLDGYMLDFFEVQSQATLVAFRTERIDGTWVAGQPTIVDYKSIAYFDPVFDALPTQDTLDQVLANAFAEENTKLYLDRLATLPESNVFRTTTFVEQGAPTARMSGRSTSSKSANGAAIAAGAVGAVLLAAGLLIYKRRQSEDDNYSYSGKPLDKNRNLHGDMTVAGETYAGETYDGSVSWGGGSRLSRDEEQGFVSIDLQNPTESYDDSSLAPAWDGGPVSGRCDLVHGIKEVISEEDSESEFEEEVSDEEHEEDSQGDMGELDVDGAYEVQADTATTASASYSSGATDDEEEDSQEGYEDSQEGDLEDSIRESYSSDSFESRVEQKGLSLSFEATDARDLNSQRAEDEDASTAAEPSLAEEDAESTVEGEARDASQDTRLSAQRPLSIAEIEYLLSADLEDDRSSQSSSVVSKTNLSTAL
jgi:hypothetical protein